MQTYVTGKKINLTKKLNPADTSLYADINLWITAGRLYFINNNSEEWISFTWVSVAWSKFNYTWLTRWLNQVADPSTAWTWLTWLAWSIWILVAMHDQLPDKQQDNVFAWTNTMTDIRFSWTTTSWLRVKSLTTAQRTALTAVNWDIVYDSDSWIHYQYIAWAWSTFATWSTANANTTVAGKVEIATSSESIAWTNTWWTGASLSVLPSDIATNTQTSTFVYWHSTTWSDTYTVSLTPALVAYVTWMKLRVLFDTSNTWACSLNVNWLWVINIKLKDWTDPLDWDITATRTYDLVYNGTNFILQLVPDRATESDITTWTNLLKFVVPSQMPKRAFIQTTRDSSSTSWTVNVAHWLWKIPKYVQLQWVNTLSAGALSLSCNWFADWTNNKSNYIIYSGWNAVAWASASACYYFQENAWYTQSATVTLDATNVIFSWTISWSAWTALTAYINILAIA